MDFNIPQKVILPTEDNKNLTIEDEELLNKIPEVLRNSVKAHFSDCNTNITTEYEKLKKKYDEEKTIYYNCINNTYKSLILNLKKAFSEKTDFEIGINGSYNSCFTSRTIDNWKLSNPGQTKAIDIFFDSLFKKGYKPEIVRISECGYDSDDGMCYGGDKLTIKCTL